MSMAIVMEHIWRYLKSKLIRHWETGCETKVTIFWGYFCPLDSRSKHQTNDSTMSESKMLNVPSRVVFVKEPPEDLSTEEMERKFSKFRGFVALRRVLTI